MADTKKKMSWKSSPELGKKDSWVNLLLNIPLFQAYTDARDRKHKQIFSKKNMLMNVENFSIKEA